MDQVEQIVGKDLVEQVSMDAGRLLPSGQAGRPLYRVAVLNSVIFSQLGLHLPVLCLQLNTATYTSVTFKCDCIHKIHRLPYFQTLINKSLELQRLSFISQGYMPLD